MIRGSGPTIVRGSGSLSDPQQRLEQVSGVSRVVMREPRDGRVQFEVESLAGRLRIREAGAIRKAARGPRKPDVPPEC